MGEKCCKMLITGEKSNTCDDCSRSLRNPLPTHDFGQVSPYFSSHAPSFLHLRCTFAPSREITCPAPGARPEGPPRAFLFLYITRPSSICVLPPLVAPKSRRAGRRRTCPTPLTLPHFPRRSNFSRACLDDHLPRCLCSLRFLLFHQRSCLATSRLGC
jgi:hypothetical protein